MTDRRRNGTWAPGHAPALGRGIRNRLAKKVFQDILDHWEEPEASNPSKCKGQIALELLYRESPASYLRLAASVLPKQFDLAASELNLPDEELDELILSLRRRMDEQRAVERREAVPVLTVVREPTR